MPWHVNNNHWIIVFIIFSTNECFIVDPVLPNDIDSRASANRFKDLTKALRTHCTYNEGECFPKLKLTSLGSENIPMQLQNDRANCGVYIVYYAFTIINGSEFSSRFNPMSYRAYLKSYLLENSEDITFICLYCSRHENSHKPTENQECVEWVSCTVCCRWIAINCIPERDRIKDYASSNFKCILCKM